MNDCAKYQHPKKIKYFLEKSQNCIFYCTFFEGLKMVIVLCFRTQMNNFTKFATLWMKFSNITSPPTGPQATAR